MASSPFEVNGCAYTLLASGNSSVNTNVTLNDDVTNYRWLYITNVNVSAIYGNIYIDNSIIPVSLYKSSDCGGFGINGYDGSQRTYAQMKYVSDTVASLQTTSAYRVYGIK